jgi:hypothetical protein
VYHKRQARANGLEVINPPDRQIELDARTQAFIRGGANWCTPAGWAAHAAAITSTHLGGWHVDEVNKKTKIP